MMADAGKSGTHEMEKDEELQGFIDLWKRMFGFMDSLGLRWAVELEIPDIIAKHGLQSMLSAEEIASYLPSPSPNMDFLSRILSFLAMRGIFTQTLLPNTQLIKYGLTPISKWLVKTRSTEGEGLQGCSMNPMVLMQTHEAVIAPWYRMGECTVSASAAFPFELVHGKLLFSFAKENPEFGRLFNDAMASHSKQLMKDILEAYGDGFSKLSFMSLVDVGGGDGSTISNIALAFPDIKCFNFDLPQVIREAPTYAGVQHIAGDMFLSVPQSDAILMKLILHDWGDEECIKLLKNCREAIPKQGKLILVDVVLVDLGERKKKLSGFEEIGVMMDMVMLAHQRGKERREGQWKQLLQASGFNRYRIIHLPSQMSIIEAFPQ